MFNPKTRLWIFIAGELGAGVILAMAAVQTYPVKYSAQLQVDRFRGEISNPANVASPFSPFLALMSIGCFGHGLLQFWKAFEIDQEILEEKEKKVKRSLALPEPEQIAQVTQQPIPQPIPQTPVIEPEQPQVKPTYKAKPTAMTRLPIRQRQAEINSGLQRNHQTQVQVIDSAHQGKVKQSGKKKSVPTFETANFTGNKLSIVFAGAPRTGKSTAQLVWMQQKFEADPNVQFRIVSQKKNRFLGLDQVPGVLQVVSRNNYYVGLFLQAKDVWDELQQRLELPEGEARESLSEYWLVLDDWFSIVANLEKSKGKLKECWDVTKGQFSDIITLGAELGVGISVNTHTLNLAHFGLAEDSNIRSVLSICAMGRIHIDKGRKEGGFDAITSVLRNGYMIDEYYTEALKKKFADLREYSIKSGLPVVLSTMGEPEINIMPDLSYIKTYQIPVDQGEVVQYFENLMQKGQSNEQQIQHDYWQEDTQTEQSDGESYGDMVVFPGQSESLDFHQNERPKNETGQDELNEEFEPNSEFDDDEDWED